MTWSDVVVESNRVAAEFESADHDLQQGPLVGQREPSTAITTEYASADPVFQAKTAVSELQMLAAQYVMTSDPNAPGTTPEVLTLSHGPGRWTMWVESHCFRVFRNSDPSRRW